MKRKPGRPRKVAESFEFPEAVKRKPGRPRKIAFAPLVESATPKLAEYLIETDSEGALLAADGFNIASNGDLLVNRAGETVAAFRQWSSIVKMEEDSAEPPKAETPEVTLSSAPPENIPNTTGYQFQGTGNVWPSNGALNAAQEFPEAARRREEAETALAATGA